MAMYQLCGKLKAIYFLSESMKNRQDYQLTVKIIQTVLLCVLATIIVIREKDFFQKDQVVQLSF